MEKERMSYQFQAQEHENLREELFRTKGTEEYEAVLARTQRALADEISDDVSSMSEEDLKDHILQYITDHNITCNLTDSPAVLTNHMYHDMAGLSFITREKLFELPGFEELDINAWDDVDIIISGKRQKTDYSFLNPQHGNDIMRRITQRTSQPFDDAVPFAVTDMGASIRIAALKFPVIDEDKEIAASIRKVSGNTITRDKLLKETLTEKMLDLLLLFVHHGVSVCFSGDTGSGKTTLSGYILGEAAKTLRTFTIEEGSREWDFVQKDENGKTTNSVVHMKTRPSANPESNINQNKALQIALRFNPTMIGIGEMRSDEAYAGAEASTTGHTVATTVHANSAEDAPDRIVGLCKKAYDFSDATLQRLVANAFPIHVYQELLPDKVRRVTEIIEVTGAENGVFQYKILAEYYVRDNLIDPETGDVTVLGDFVWRNPISEKLRQRMLKKGATRSQLAPYIEDGMQTDSRKPAQSKAVPNIQRKSPKQPQSAEQRKKIQKRRQRIRGLR